MTRPNIPEIKARCEAATEGPGFTGFCNVTSENINQIKEAMTSAIDASIDHDGGHPFVWVETNDKRVIAYFGNGPTSNANAALWTNAKKDIPALIAYVEELERLLFMKDGRIKELHAGFESLSENCISLNLHESRVRELERQIQGLKVMQGFIELNGKEARNKDNI